MHSLIKLIFAATLAAIIGCNQQSSNSELFKTKADSIAFAKKIFEIYPEEQGPKIADFGGGKKSIKTLDNINWSRVLEYGANYTKHPLIRNKNGFLIDANGMNLLRSHTNYQQVFLRFGKFSDDPKVLDDYTVMLIPLGAERRVLH